MSWFRLETWTISMERWSYASIWLMLGLLLVQATVYWPFYGLLIAFVLVVKAIQGMAGNGSVTFGSARWADYFDLKNAGCLWGQSGFVLGRMALRPRISFTSALWAVFFSSAVRVHEAVALAKWFFGRTYHPLVRVPDPGPPHIAIYSPSGGGKTTAYAVPTALHDPSSMVVLDPKGDIYKLTAKHRQRVHGHKIVVIDPYGIAAPEEKRSKFNPLSLYRGEPKTIVDESRRLANALVVRPKGEKEPFWNNAAQVVLQMIIAFLIAVARPEEANLNRLRDLIANPKVLRELLEFLEGCDACGGLLQRLAGMVRWYQGQTESSIYAVANTHLEFLDSLPIMETLSETTFDPKELANGRMTIYLCLPVDRIHELRGLQRIMITSLIHVLFQAGESRTRRVRFLLDEAVSLGEIEALYSALVFGRSFGMRLTFFFQSMSQIEQCFPESKAADFRATTASVFSGITEYGTAKEVSQWIGQTTVHSQSWQSSSNSGGSMTRGGQEHSSGTNWGTSESYTTTEVGRALIQPEEVLQLPKWAAIALLPGLPPIYVEKQPYYERSREPSTLWRIGESVGRLAGAVFFWMVGATILFGLAIGNMERAIALSLRDLSILFGG